jgi:hypothetical protein
MFVLPHPYLELEDKDKIKIFIKQMNRSL